MTASAWIALASLLLAVFGIPFGLVKFLAKRDREEVDRKIQTILTENRQLRAELTDAKVDLGRLKERIAGLPTHTALTERLERLEARLERRLEDLGELLVANFDRAVDLMRRPQNPSGGGL